MRRSRNRGDCGPGWAGYKSRAYLKNHQCEKGWWSGSSGKAPQALSSNPSTAKRKRVGGEEMEILASVYLGGTNIIIIVFIRGREASGVKWQIRSFLLTIL
jgi:hypothetical protein